MTKIIFEPGSFDKFEGTQEELDAFVAKLTEILSNEEFLKNLNETIDVVDDDEAEEIREIFNKSSRTVN